MGRRVAVTGASGFVGGHTVARMLDLGWHVGVLARPSSDLTGRGWAADAQVVRCDGSVPALAAGLEELRPEAVVHLAGTFVGAHTAGDVDPLLDANVAFGTRLLEAMRLAGPARLVNTGTAWQFATEGGYRPINLYAAMKEAFQRIVDWYAEAADFGAVTLHLADTYGPHDPRGKVVHLLLHAAVVGAHIEMSPGRQLLDLTHVVDVASAYCLAVDHVLNAGPGHRSFRATAGELIELRALARLVEDVAGRPLDAAWGARPYPDRLPLRPWTRGELLPGWEARIPLAEGLAGLVGDASAAGG